MRLGRQVRQNLPYRLDGQRVQSVKNTEHLVHYNSASQSSVKTLAPQPHTLEKKQNDYDNLCLFKRPVILIHDIARVPVVSFIKLEYKAKPNWLWGRNTNRGPHFNCTHKWNTFKLKSTFPFSTLLNNLQVAYCWSAHINTSQPQCLVTITQSKVFILRLLIKAFQLTDSVNLNPATAYTL